MNKQFKFTFIDLFAGIGGFHIALDSLGGKCLFASEIDESARATYIQNFKTISPNLFSENKFNKDIRTINPQEIPDFDILCAGFPCQPFSQAGHKRGFKDTHKSERGNLFFNIAEILDVKRPKAFFLENVRGILNHDNGNTFRVIREILEDELNYNMYTEVVFASDFGLPQLRPRVFMIGFRDEGFFKSFQIPSKKPLKFNMSDVWQGNCSREIGFTIRVGGRGSNINDRRNWDSYLVDDQIKLLMPEQAKKMQGFPDDFQFPVSSTEAMKQLGNSVAIDPVKEYSKAMLGHLDMINSKQKKSNIYISNTKNKGEWTELYSFLKIIKDKKIFLSDKNLEIQSGKNYLNVTKVSTLNIQEACYLDKDDKVIIFNEVEGTKNIVDVSNFINDKAISNLLEKIKNNTGTFEIDEFTTIQDSLGISIIKGGNSSQKADILLDIHNEDIARSNEGFGIKSYLGSKPTLLNSSTNTNFIYEIENLDVKYFDEINLENKLSLRIKKIIDSGGVFNFSKVEKDTMDYNLSLVDTILPELVAKMLLEFYINRTSLIEKNLHNIFQRQELLGISDSDIGFFKVKLKRFLVAILLGFFAGKKWDGKYVSQGTIVVKENGEQVVFHLIDLDTLEDFLYENIKFDTPSTTRHNYGSLILEDDGKMYFKLNIQLRF